MKRTTIVRYKIGNVTYSHRFPKVIPHSEAERLMIMEHRVGRSAILSIADEKSV